MPVVHAVERHEATGLPAGVPVVGNGAAPVLDPGSEDLADGLVQGSDPLLVKGGRSPSGPDARPEEGLVRVDVPDPRDLPLVE